MGGLVKGLVWIAGVTGVKGSLFVVVTFLLAATFATAVGTVCGLLVLSATLWIISRGGDVLNSHLRLLAQYFIGYTVTVKGGFIAFGYSFFWGFLSGWLFAYLRNIFLAIYIYNIKRKAELLSLKDFFDNF